MLCSDELTVSTVTLNTGLNFASHAHARDKLCFVGGGHYEENCDAMAYSLRGAMAFLRVKHFRNLLRFLIA